MGVDLLSPPLFGTCMNAMQKCWERRRWECEGMRGRRGGCCYKLLVVLFTALRNWLKQLDLRKIFEKQKAYVTQNVNVHESKGNQPLAVAQSPDCCRNQYGYKTPAFLGPHSGDRSIWRHKHYCLGVPTMAKKSHWLHKCCLLGVPKVGRNCSGHINSCISAFHMAGRNQYSYINRHYRTKSPNPPLHWR